jgi:hypothetical protein
MFSLLFSFLCYVYDYITSGFQLLCFVIIYIFISITQSLPDLFLNIYHKLFMCIMLYFTLLQIKFLIRFFLIWIIMKFYKLVHDTVDDDAILPKGLDNSLYGKLYHKYNCTYNNYYSFCFYIIPNMMEVKDPDDENIVTKLSSDGYFNKYINVVYNVQYTIMDIVYRDSYYTVVQLSNRYIIDMMLDHVIQNYNFQTLFCILCNLLLRLIVTDNAYELFDNDDRNFKYKLYETGVQRLYDASHTYCFVRDYDITTTSFVPMLAFEKINLQARSTTDPTKVEPRIKAAINVLCITSSIPFNSHYSIALCSVYVDEYKLYIKLSESLFQRIYKWRLNFWIWFTSLFHWSVGLRYDRSVVHRRTCFGIGNYLQQKPKSSVTSTSNDCSGTDDQFWYTYSDCAYEHITYPKNCICNCLRAVKDRQCCHLSDYYPARIHDMYSWVEMNIDKLFPITDFETYSQTEWFESLLSRKKPRKRQGIERVEEYGFVDQYRTNVEPLLKIEALNSKEYGTSFKMQNIAPRLVSGRQQDYDVIGGPRIKKISKILCKMWNFIDEAMPFIDTVPGITYYSTGHNKVSIGQWMVKQKKKKMPIFYNTDYKRFDASTIDCLMALEACVYCYLNPDDPEFVDWLSTQLDTEGTLRVRAHANDPQWEKVKYFCRGTRKSGDQNTSVGNTIINVLVQLYCLDMTVDFGYTGVIRNTVFDAMDKGQLDILALGDDTVICLDSMFIDQKSYVTLVRDLGLIIKLERKTCDNVTFCSSYFIPAIVNGEESYILTQKPGRNLSRAYNNHMKFSSQQHVDGWIKSNAYAYMKDFQHVPFMYKWHQVKYKYYRHAKAVTTDNEEYHVPNDIVIGPSDNYQAWLLSVYGLAGEPDISHMINNWDNMDLHDIFSIDVYGNETLVEPSFKLPDCYINPHAGVLKVKGGRKFLPYIMHRVDNSNVNYKHQFILPQLLMLKVESKQSFLGNFQLVLSNIINITLDIPWSNYIFELVNKAKTIIAPIVKPTPIPRSHPVCRGERTFMLSYLLDHFHNLGNAVYDIGSRMGRNRAILNENRWKLDISGCQPNLGNKQIRCDNTVSNLTIQEVIDNVQFTQPTSLMSVDCLYYFNEDEVFSILDKPNIIDYYSLHCKFYSESGTIANGEVQWQTVNNSAVFKVKDNDIAGQPIDEVYSHDTLEYWNMYHMWDIVKPDGTQYRVRKELVISGDVYDIWRFIKL